ncbi:MAG: class IV adenylate cyclase [Gemmatimonadota bacterium]|nr:class IV adenylate cyclase [Gemmatimonadota bacterium]
MQTQADQTVEIKARCRDPEAIRAAILAAGAQAQGYVTQMDTFYNVPQGRLKLRRGGKESLLIGYLRPDQPGPKHCLVDLYPCRDADSLDKVLSGTLGVKAVVKKERSVFLLGDRVKFHLDRVESLGDFVEIEVLGVRDKDTVEELKETCEKYLDLLGISGKDLVERAYVDLLLDLEPDNNSA